MANIVLKAPSTIAAGSQYQARDGTVYTIAAGGLLTIPVGSQNIQDALNAGFTVPSMFGAVSAGITAKVGGGQSGATALGYGINQISVVTSALDSVALPSAVPGEFVTVINDDATDAAQIFGTGTDTINGVATATGILLPPRSVMTFSCAVAGAWRVVPAQGFSGAGNTPAFGPAANGISSNGTTQGNGTALAARINRVTTTGAVNGAVTLPAATPGDMRIVTNVGANSANVYPAVNESITPGAANAALNLAANKTVILSCAVAGQWDAVLTA